MAGTNVAGDHVIAEVYNTRSGRWSSKDFGKTGFNPNPGVIGHQAVFLGGVITRDFGGGNNFTRIARVYHADSGKWSRTIPKEGISSNATISVALPDKLVFARNEVLNVYDPKTGHWSWTATPIQVSYTTAIQAVGNQFIVYDGAQIHRIEFTGQHTVNPPVVSNPQTDVGTTHASFCWTSTPDASGYDVYIDGRYYGFSTVDFWSSDSSVLTPGKHLIRVTAVGLDFQLDGPTSEFIVSE